jgi:F-type H+-transporting ATPase subunit a
VANDPLHQFQIQVLAPAQLGALDASFSTSSLFMLASAALVLGGLSFGMRKAALVPSRGQSVAEQAYGFVEGMVRGIAGDAGKPLFPFVFTLFSFIFMVNMLGMVPYFFTPTAQLIVPVALALLVFVSVLVIGFAKSGFGFLKLFFPSGLPWPLYFIVTPIELISFFSRPLSHSVRLWANIFAGHLVLKLFAGFSVQLAAPETGLGALGLIGALLPLLLSVAMTALEFLVAFLQAYVFALLTCVYLNDALHADHH